MTVLLCDLKANRGAHPKSDVIRRIRESDWFELVPEDRIPFPTVPTEARWITSVAWARKQCVEDGLLTNDARDSWEITREGINSFVSLKTGFKSGKVFVSECFFWTEKFKKLIMEGLPYDHKRSFARPEYVYKDMKPWFGYRTPSAAVKRRLETDQDFRKELDELMNSLFGEP